MPPLEPEEDRPLHRKRRPHIKVDVDETVTTEILPLQQRLGIGGSKPTIYDAVAGRVNLKGKVTGRSSKINDLPLTPEEVLFRPPRAPVRYEEDDIYFRHEKLRPDQRLPDSDLLKALHAYASDYYYCNAAADPPSDQGVADFGSMDETALLAMGILLEEAARQKLGETGDMALVEPEDEDDREDPMIWTGQEWEKRIIPEKMKGVGRKRKQTENDEASRKRARTENVADEGEEDMEDDNG